MRNLLLSIMLCLVAQTIMAQHSIIPEPVNYNGNGETLIIKDNLAFNVLTKDKEAIEYANQFKEYVDGFSINTSKANNAPTLSINLNKKKNTELGTEGYTLKVTASEISLTANEAAGIFNGFQTLKQLLPATPEVAPADGLKIAGCTITDYPRFKWRGLMLDVSRHFFTVDEVKEYIDKMAEYKFNVFHWHLTDDNGWRIEIKSLPKLTEIGAWRVERFGRFGETRPTPKADEATPYGGFYTQEQIKDVIEYAANKNITIVPEIDVPGHSMAALAAYPELATDKKPKYVSPGDKFSEWYGDGTFKMLVENALNPSDEKVYEFLDKVFTEVAELFPGEYIHMGGDECYHGYWEEDPAVREFMKKHDIADGEELQSYFVSRVEKIITSKGKKVIGWDEILAGELAKNTAVMSWQGMKGGIKAAKMEHPVVMSPTTFAYLDYSQGDHNVENWIYAKLSLEKTYEFEPVPEGVDAQYILGGQGNLWTEVIPTMPFAFYMTYPRALSLSETLWSPKAKKNWNSFIKKTEVHFDRFDATGTNISKAVYEPQVKIYEKDGKMFCELSNSIPNSKIYYTIDNTYPVNFGNEYKGAFEIPNGELNLRTQTFRNNKALGREIIISREELTARIKK
ncbi:MAG: beta-N-acetylhexosaminidase [Thalassobius sp.]|nr:beta-N-acetylhexosaminidase [Thalassovita sp.]